MTTAIEIAGGIAALIGTGGLGTLAGSLYTTKRAADSRDHAAELQAERQSARDAAAAAARHAETLLGIYDRTRAELSAAHSTIELRASQMGEFMGELVALKDRFEHLKAANDACEERSRTLARRVSELERRLGGNPTPANDTPSVGIGQIRPPALPPMHESVGGYRHGR